MFDWLWANMVMPMRIDERTRLRGTFNECDISAWLWYFWERGGAAVPNARREKKDFSGEFYP
jgi:hypothetical protein